MAGVGNVTRGRQIPATSVQRSEGLPGGHAVDVVLHGVRLPSRREALWLDPSAVEAGWDLARQREEVHSGADEIAITECLRDGMRDALEEKSLRA